MDQMKLMKMTDEKRDEILMEAGRKRLLPWSRIGMVDKEYREPTFTQFTDRTAWGLYNAFTYIVQKSPARSQISAMANFRELVLPNN